MSLARLLTRNAAGALGFVMVAWIAVASGVTRAAPPADHETTYEIEQFPYPSGIPGVEFANDSAISNGARLASAYDETFNPIAVIRIGGSSEVFQITPPDEGYSWFNGINDKRTTVGITLQWADFRTTGWIRDRDGHLHTLDNPDGDVYLYRVNNKDVAVGELVSGFGFFRPAMAYGDELTVIDPAGVDAGHPAYFAGINDMGAIVGGAYDPDTWEHTCLLWDRHGVTTISHEGAGMIAPRAINNRGQVAGFWIESDFDPLIGSREHGFIREADGTFRTVDIDFPFEEEIDLGEPEPFVLVDKTTKILDLNDHGEIVIEATGWYLGHFVFDGMTYDYVLPVWTNAVGTPKGRGRSE